MSAAAADPTTAGEDAEAAAEATEELIHAIEKGELTQSGVPAFTGRGADPRHGLAIALQISSIVAILALAAECSLMDSETPKKPSPDELLGLASIGDWAHVAYYIALEPGDVGNFLDASDATARRTLKEAMGVVEARLPRDIVLPEDPLRKNKGRGCGIRQGIGAFASGPDGLSPVILVEQPRWLLPRPRPEDLFVYARDEKRRLEEGWYRVGQHPASDDPREAVLWKPPGTVAERQELAKLVREPRWGETLLCKAVKANQWDLVEWIMKQEPDEASRRGEQLEREFKDIWREGERRATLRSQTDLVELLELVDDNGVLTRSWRSGALMVPCKSRVKWPALSILKEARALDKLGLEGLRRYCGGIVTFVVRPVPNVGNHWAEDLSALGEPTFGRPLLHWATLAGRCHLVRMLLEADAEPDAVDSDGFTALVLAASARKYDVMDLLLEFGCSVDGRWGALATTSLRRVIAAAAATAFAGGDGVVGGAAPGWKRATTVSAEEMAQAAALLEKISAQSGQVRTASLSEFFLRQAKGELVSGKEPRRFQLEDAALKPKRGRYCVWSRALILGEVTTGSHAVYFVEVNSGDYLTIKSQASINLNGRRLISESQLEGCDAVAVVVPHGRLKRESGGFIVQPASSGPVASSLPQFARALPVGEIRLTSETACCCIAIGRVEVRAEGMRLGETPHSLGDPVSCEVCLFVPRRNLDISLEFSGRILRTEMVEISSASPSVALHAEVPLAVFVYVTTADAEQGLEFVWVCGHKRDLPDDPPARPFVGTVRWNSGQQRLTSMEPVELGGSGCLQQLVSLVFEPDLPKGRCFEAVEWEDTGECQFKRLLINVVRVGKIFPESS